LSCFQVGQHVSQEASYHELIFTLRNSNLFQCNLQAPEDVLLGLRSRSKAGKSHYFIRR